jgi:hypothetical protein
LGLVRTFREAQRPFFPAGGPVDVLGQLVGRLGLSKSDALSLTRDELEAVLRHALEKEKDEWRRTRWLATVIVNIEGKSVKKTVQETDLLRFDDEKRESSLRALLRQYEQQHDGQRNPRP